MTGWQLYAMIVFMGLTVFLSWKAQLATSVEQVAWGLVLLFIVVALGAVISAYMPAFSAISQKILNCL